MFISSTLLHKHVSTWRMCEKFLHRRYVLLLEIQAAAQSCQIYWDTDLEFCDWKFDAYGCVILIGKKP